MAVLFKNSILVTNGGKFSHHEQSRWKLQGLSGRSTPTRGQLVEIFTPPGKDASASSEPTCLRHNSNSAVHGSKP